MSGQLPVNTNASCSQSKADINLRNLLFQSSTKTIDKPQPQQQSEVKMNERPMRQPALTPTSASRTGQRRHRVLRGNSAEAGHQCGAKAKYHDYKEQCVPERMINVTAGRKTHVGFVSHAAIIREQCKGRKRSLASLQNEADEEQNWRLSHLSHNGLATAPALARVNKSIGDEKDIEPGGSESGRDRQDSGLSSTSCRIVTATANSSSGDDRYSSGEGRKHHSGTHSGQTYSVSTFSNKSEKRGSTRRRGQIPLHQSVALPSNDIQGFPVLLQSRTNESQCGYPPTLDRQTCDSSGACPEGQNNDRFSGSSSCSTHDATAKSQKSTDSDSLVTKLRKSMDKAARKLLDESSYNSLEDMEAGRSSCESGSDGGYAGSVSSNEAAQSSCSSPSVSSFDCRTHHVSINPGHLNMPATNKKGSSLDKGYSFGTSSEIADFSSGASGQGASSGVGAQPSSFIFHLRSSSSSQRSSQLSSTSSGDGFSDEQVKNKADYGTAGASKQRKSTRSTGDLQRPPDISSKARREKVHHRHNRKARWTSHQDKKQSKKLHVVENVAQKHKGGQLKHLTSSSKRAKMEQAIDRRAQTCHHVQLEENFKAAFRQRTAYLDRVSKSFASSTKSIGLSSTFTELPSNGRPPLLNIGSDIMGQCLSYMEPPEVYRFLSMPLSKEWRATFTLPQDVWRILCLSEPFKAKVGVCEGSSESGNDYSACAEHEVQHISGNYRLLYTSLVRCMNYLARIKDDAISGRTPTVFTNEVPDPTQYAFDRNSSLKTFLATARGALQKRRGSGDTDTESSFRAPLSKRKKGDESNVEAEPVGEHAAAMGPIGVSDDGSATEEQMKKKARTDKTTRGPKYSHSALTARLLGPSKSGTVGDVNLPWSCAIYSILNWMVAFADVEGIQTMCLKVLPFLLEDENQRINAQGAGLTDIVLRDMVLFPDSVQLHTAAFHTIVLLARPLGGKEGMLFNASMVNSSGIFNSDSMSGKSGIAVMLDSMRRFDSDEVLQEMSCWSMVNIALIPSQKAVLVKLGGISVIANAMRHHPYNPEVQFRALFSLINLVIPSDNAFIESADAEAMQEQLGEVNNTTEREMLDENIGQIVELVVLAMKTFCSSESILNRACLVLHNLSLNEDYHTVLLWTPNCYQMLEWCLANYRRDAVLQSSASGTLHRLQTTLARDDELRARFTESIRAQQKLILEQAKHESELLNSSQGLQ